MSVTKDERTNGQTEILVYNIGFRPLKEGCMILLSIKLRSTYEDEDEDEDKDDWNDFLFLPVHPVSPRSFLILPVSPTAYTNLKSNYLY